eukprot:1152919-Amphidinium_carterae.5
MPRSLQEPPNRSQCGSASWKGTQVVFAYASCLFCGCSTGTQLKVPGVSRKTSHTLGTSCKRSLENSRLGFVASDGRHSLGTVTHATHWLHRRRLRRKGAKDL